MDTSAAIIEAFEQCVVETGYDKTSIDDICAKAHVSRRTFYRCFQGKQAVFEKIIDSYLLDPIAGIYDLAFGDQLNFPHLLTYDRSMVAILNKKDFFKKTLNNEHLELVGYYFQQLLIIHRESFDSPDMSEDEREFAAYSTTCASIGSIMHWLEDDCSISPEQFVRYGLRWIFARPREIGVGKFHLD